MKSRADVRRRWARAVVTDCSRAYSVEKLDAIAPSVARFQRDFELFRALRFGGGGD
jgi:hypothetical protein